jgi:hypothetical protein
MSGGGQEGSAKSCKSTKGITGNDDDIVVYYQYAAGAHETSRPCAPGFLQLAIDLKYSGELRVASCFRSASSYVPITTCSASYPY